MLFQVCGNKLKKAWFLRPKIEVISEEDKENINSNQINQDYFDNRGAPAPAPWANEKRVDIKGSLLNVSKTI